MDCSITRYLLTRIYWVPLHSIESITNHLSLDAIEKDAHDLKSADEQNEKSQELQSKDKNMPVCEVELKFQLYCTL